jgi:hypothetical protein
LAAPDFRGPELRPQPASLCSYEEDQRAEPASSKHTVSVYFKDYAANSFVKKKSKCRKNKKGNKRGNCKKGHKGK